MAEEERIRQLEAENATLHEQVSRLQAQLVEQTALRERVTQLEARLAELEGRLAKDSHNSSQPPSSDGQGHKTRSQRQPSGKKSGGQCGHAGQSLQLVAQPDTIERHRPRECAHCHEPLAGVAGQIIERRQVQDLPVCRLAACRREADAHSSAMVYCAHE